MSEFKIRTSIELDDSKAKKQMATLQESTKGKPIKLDVQMNTSSLNNLKQLEAVLTKINALSAKTQNSLFGGKSFNNSGISKVSSQFTKLQRDATNLQSKLASLGKSGYVDTSKLKALSSDLKKIQNLNFKNMNSSGMNAAISGMESLKNKYKELESATKQSKFNAKFDINTSKAQTDLDRLRQKALELGQSTSGIDKLEAKLKELSNLPMDKKANELARIKSQISGMKSSFSGLNSSLNTTNRFFQNLYSSMSTFTLGNMIGMGMMNFARNIKTTIVELDSSFRDLMKVAPDNFRGTTEDLNSLRDSAIEAGVSVARSSTDIIQGTAKALQTGIKDINDAMEYATKSAQFANVSDLSSEDANTYLTSIMSAYGGVVNSLKPLRAELQGAGKDYNNLTKFSDLANYAGNNFAVTTGDVGAALQRSASVLAGFGTSMEDSIALVVGMQESTQNAEKTG
ncbi:TPA: phage tail tape measure protein [Clostridioides difficile]|nr:phage tail tape measure protein [Clostridioides difficile]HEK8924591.1 phage tail tape measure protein [Clostridioides difficile]